MYVLTYLTDQLRTDSATKLARIIRFSGKPGMQVFMPHAFPAELPDPSITTAECLIFFAPDGSHLAVHEPGKPLFMRACGI
jgi:hypothetical protein